MTAPLAGRSIVVTRPLAQAGALADAIRAAGGTPFKLDSAPPSQPIKNFMDSETRFAMLARSHPEAAERLAAAAQEEADRRFKAYQALAAAHADTPKAGA